ncbi:uncharacterized protein [Nicotiana sylvestris]|uniref:uncharacterized protein isoform X2 n=1 Tax=Nicotiana sylvestris TaxID=4096 RepID=UPI00388C7985
MTNILQLFSPVIIEAKADFRDNLHAYKRGTVSLIVILENHPSSNKLAKLSLRIKMNHKISVVFIFVRGLLHGRVHQLRSTKPSPKKVFVSCACVGLL